MALTSGYFPVDIQRVKGFSLIEVLVASFILFLVIGTVTMTFSGSVKSTLSATESLNLYGYTPYLAEHITLSVRNGEREGSSHFMDMSFEWSSQLIETKELALFYDANSFQYLQSNRKASLWKVTLITHYRDRSISHDFNVVSW